MTLRHQRHHPFTVYTRPRDATSPASTLSTWAQASATPHICLHHRASRWAWTLVPGLFLANLYSSPGLGLNVPSHQHVPKKTGLNEITAQHEAPHSSYANNGQWLRGGFPSCWLHSGRKTRSLRDTIKDSFRKYIEQWIKGMRCLQGFCNLEGRLFCGLKNSYFIGQTRGDYRQENLVKYKMNSHWAAVHWVGFPVKWKGSGQAGRLGSETKW